MSHTVVKYASSLLDQMNRLSPRQLIEQILGDLISKCGRAGKIRIVRSNRG